MSEPSDSRRLNLRESLLKFLEPIRSQPGKENSASHVSAARQERRGVPDSLFRQTCRTYVCFTVSGSFYFVTESSFRISCKTNVCFTESRNRKCCTFCDQKYAKSDLREQKVQMHFSISQGRTSVFRRRCCPAPPPHMCPGHLNCCPRPPSAPLQIPFIVREILFLPSSTERTFTVTTSPTLTASSGCFMYRSDIWEIWTSPS